jgi:hypothetical protein
MNKASIAWEEDTIWAFFHEGLANTILQVPISKLVRDDFASWFDGKHGVTRVNSTNVLDEGLRIGGIGRQMNSKVKSVKQGVYQK